MISTGFKFSLKKSIVFVGMMGCGKSAVGRIVASMIGVPYGDTDIEVESTERMSIMSLFEERGEAYFRTRETAMLKGLLDGPVRAVSLGGGGFLVERNREIIRRCGVSVWLEANADLLWERVRNRSKRPLLETENPYQTLVDLLQRRTPEYAKADIRVSAEPSLSKEGMASKVVDTILASPRSNEILVRVSRS